MKYFWFSALWIALRIRPKNRLMKSPKETQIKSVRGECFPFAPSIHRASAALGTNGKCIEPWLSDLICVSLMLYTIFVSKAVD